MRKSITEQPSHYDHLERMSVGELLQHINEEDMLVADAVRRVVPQIRSLVEAIEPKMKHGGRLFYVGAGTSGRLGVLDASELPPTFGVPEGRVVGIIAGGDEALRHAVEKAEDVPEQGWHDLETYHPTADDTILGIAASGTTPYVIGAVSEAKKHGLLTGCITSNPNTPLAAAVDYPVETIVGPEFVTGSSRMKSGTAQKMILNMISTTLMIRMGRVSGNRMVKMQLTNAKLVDRGTRMIQDSLGIPYNEAERCLLEAGSVDRVLKETQIERHPFEPFLPADAKLLMLGTFPPAEKRWSMPFYYPNFTNDMWRIVGYCFFGDKQHFVADDGKHYRLDELKTFLTTHGIALYDTCTRIIRTKNTASDKDLQVVEQTDIRTMLQRLPQCKTIVTAGQLATTLCARQLGVEEPQVGTSVSVEIEGRIIRLYRMPSSSRAYPMAIEKKAAFYQEVFDTLK